MSLPYDKDQRVFTEAVGKRDTQNIFLLCLLSLIILQNLVLLLLFEWNKSKLYWTDFTYALTECDIIYIVVYVNFSQYCLLLCNLLSLVLEIRTGSIRLCRTNVFCNSVVC